MNQSLSLTEDLIISITAGEVDPLNLPEDQLQSLCETLNAAYRAGRPLVDDAAYDQIFTSALRTINPDNPFLNSVEPEGEVFNAPTVRHLSPMLSTEKAYTGEAVTRFVERLKSTAAAIGLKGPVMLKVTPKLDGIACRDDGLRLVTRGDGSSGSDITHILDRGAVIAGGVRGEGPGEIVVRQSYFDEVLKPRFSMSHPRNYITGFCGADSVKDHHREAAQEQAVVFVPYTTLEGWIGTADDFLAKWQVIASDLKQTVPFLTDGAVVEAIDSQLKAELGATSSHHRWMLALKEKGDTAVTRAKSITWQTGRTGRITPVVELEPIYLSGANISRVTAHHAGMVASMGIGPGAELEIIRSGEVIPKIERVVTPVQPTLPEHCPCCEHQLNMEGDFLVCPNNLGCSAQVATGLIHFFKTLGNIDLFGPKTVETLVSNGLADLPVIYGLTVEQLVTIGFGPGQAANLVRELQRSKSQEVEDWRFLAAFGIPNLGRGDSRRLLEGFTLEQLLEPVSADQIVLLDGFGDLTSNVIAGELAERAELIGMLASTFNLRRTGAAAPQPTNVGGGALNGKHVVFTGTMKTGSRDALQEQAREHGATVQSSVNSKTNYLVCGDKVGASKTTKAEKLGVKVITEADYLAMLG